MKMDKNRMAVCSYRPSKPSVEEFCQGTTWHGVSDLYASKGSGRVFWGLALILATIAACYGCYAIIAQYRESPVVISYMIHPSQGHRKLPDVVICPFNRFNISYLNRYSVPEDLIEYIQSAFSLNTPYKFQRTKAILPENMTAYSRELDKLLARMGNITFEELINRASFSCNALIKYCAFPSGLQNCCSNAESVITPVGKCYRLMGPRQISSGFGFGMTVVAMVPADKYMSPGRNNLHNVGISVKLAEKGKGLDFDLTFVPAGVHALMPLRATRYEFIDDPPRYECFTKVSENYSSVRCFDDCFFAPGMQRCNCRHVTSPNTDYRACRPDEFFYCLVIETMKTISNGTEKTYVKDCQHKCMTPCSYWAFHPTVSYATFPSSTFYHYMRGKKENTDWERTIVLDVFYEKLEFTLIKHFPSMTPDTFVANIGGQVGLWIGGSVLSLAQLVVFLMHYCCSSIWRRQGDRLDVVASGTTSPPSGNANGDVPCRDADRNNSGSVFSTSTPSCDDFLPKYGYENYNEKEGIPPTRARGNNNYRFITNYTTYLIHLTSSSTGAATFSGCSSPASICWKHKRLRLSSSDFSLDNFGCPNIVVSDQQGPTEQIRIK